MLVIKTDEELKQERKELAGQLNVLKAQYRGLLDLRLDYQNMIKLSRDTKVVEEIEELLNKLDEEIMFGELGCKITAVKADIQRIDKLLEAKPSMPVGCIYSTYHDLDLHDIELHGIIGVKL